MLLLEMMSLLSRHMQPYTKSVLKHAATSVNFTGNISMHEMFIFCKYRCVNSKFPLRHYFVVSLVLCGYLEVTEINIDFFYSASNYLMMKPDGRHPAVRIPQ